MKIETNFDLHDEIWVMYKNKPESFLVLDIFIECTDSGGYFENVVKVIRYKVVNTARENNSDYHLYFNEPDVFADRESLLKSL